MIQLLAIQEDVLLDIIMKQQHLYHVKYAIQHATHAQILMDFAILVILDIIRLLILRDAHNVLLIVDCVLMAIIVQIAILDIIMSQAAQILV